MQLQYLADTRAKALTSHLSRLNQASYEASDSRKVSHLQSGNLFSLHRAFLQKGSCLLLTSRLATQEEF